MFIYRCSKNGGRQLRLLSISSTKLSKYRLSDDIPQKMAGVLVDSTMDNSRVISREQAFKKYKNDRGNRSGSKRKTDEDEENEGDDDDGGDGSISSSMVSRFDAKTLRGKMSLSGTLRLGDSVADGINEYILKVHAPNHLRQSAANYYIELQNEKIHRPCKTTMEVDAHIASIFLQNYGSLYQSLFELRKQCENRGQVFQPQRVLDVGYGPATGIVALNELLGSRYRPELKDSVILSSLEMQKRAKIILSRQCNEVPDVKDTVVLPKKEEEEEDDVEKTKDDIEEGDKMIGAVDTKKIKIVTNIKDKVPGPSKKYDLIMVQHQLLKATHEFPLQVEHNLQHYLKLLAPNGHLVIVERGNPLGFEIIARARELIVRSAEGQTEKKPILWGQKNVDHPEENVFLKVIAPCTHHHKCPLQVGNPNFYDFKKIGNLKFCNNQKKIQRPKFSIELKRGKILNSKWDEDNNFEEGKKMIGSGRQNGLDYEILNYTYLIVQRSDVCDDTDLNSNNARIVDQPLKKKGHVHLNVCDSEGKIGKWIIPKSFNKQIYHDVRKSQKNDLWEQGAKTKMLSKNLFQTGKINDYINMDKKLQRLKKQNLKKDEFEINDTINKIKTGDIVDGVPQDDKSRLNKEIELMGKLYGNNFQMSEKGKKTMKNMKKTDLQKVFESS